MPNYQTITNRGKLSFPKKTLTHNIEFNMYKDKTEKRQKYYDEVIRLHFEKGYGEDRIAKILPI